PFRSDSVEESWMTSHQTLTVTRPADGVAVVEMAEPGSLNLWNRTLQSELTRALDSLARDPQVRAVGLMSRGRAFCAGADLRDLRQRLGSTGPMEQEVEGILARAITRDLQRAPKPVVAAV